MGRIWWVKEAKILSGGILKVFDSLLPIPLPLTIAILVLLLFWFQITLIANIGSQNNSSLEIESLLLCHHTFLLNLITAVIKGIGWALAIHEEGEVFVLRKVSVFWGALTVKRLRFLLGVFLKIRCAVTHVPDALLLAIHHPRDLRVQLRIIQLLLAISMGRLRVTHWIRQFLQVIWLLEKMCAILLLMESNKGHWRHIRRIWRYSTLQFAWAIFRNIWRVLRFNIWALHVQGGHLGSIVWVLTQESRREELLLQLSEVMTVPRPRLAVLLRRLLYQLLQYLEVLSVLCGCFIELIFLARWFLEGGLDRV